MAPQIVEYTAPENLGLRPTETGVTATAAAARRVGGAYSEAAQTTKEAGQRIGAGIAAAGEQVIEWQARKEISQGAAAFAGLMNEKTKQWHETNTNADPNDPTVAKNFQDSLEGDLAKFKSGFLTQKGQDWAELRVEDLRKHMFHQTASDRATAAGHAQTINADTAKQGFANSALWAGDENGTKAAMDSWTASPFHSKIIEAGKADIVSSGALGAIKKTGEVPEWVKKPEYRNYVDAEKLDKEAYQQKTHDRTLNSAARRENNYQQTQAFNKGVSDFYRDTLPVNNTSRPQLPADYKERLDKLQPNDDAPPAIQKAYQALIKHVDTVTDRLNRPEPMAVTSHRNAMEVVGKIRNGEITDLNQIDDYYQSTPSNPNGRLNTSDYNFVRKEFNELRTSDGIRLTEVKKDFFTGIKKSITKSNPLMGVMDQDGDEQLYRFEQFVDAKVAEYRAAHKNPHDLFNPNKPEDYVGSAAVIQPYQKPLDQSMRDAVSRMNPAQAPKITPPTVTPPVAPAPTVTAPPAEAPPAPPPTTVIRRKEGESIFDYRARIGVNPSPRPTAPPPGGI